MKRSDMINHIWNFLLVEEDLQDRETAAYLLEYLEELGMLPPERYRDHDWNKKGMTYSEWLQLSSKVNEWENEDDFK